MQPKSKEQVVMIFSSTVDQVSELCMTGWRYNRFLLIWLLKDDHISVFHMIFDFDQ